MGKVLVGNIRGPAGPTDPYEVVNADPTGAADSTAAFQNALDLVTPGQPIRVAPGTYKIAGNLTSTTMPFIFEGPGRESAVFNHTGSGDMLRVYRDGSYLGHPSGSIKGISINGSSAAAGACGLHLGDVFQFELDVDINHFNGVGSVGLHLDNTRYWTEQLHGQVFVQFNSTNVLFDNSVDNSGFATGSFDRLNLDIYVDQGGYGDGVVFNNGAFVVDGHLGIYGNFLTSTSQYACLRIEGSNVGDGPSHLTSIDLQIGVELNDAAHLAPYTIYFGTTGNFVYACTGRVSFGFNPWTSTNQHSNQFRFQGIIIGDYNLTNSITTQPYSDITAMSNGASIAHGYAGAIYTTNGGSSYTGIILQVGNFTGQRLIVLNEGAGTLTFAAVGTSKVANGTSCVIAANTGKEFIWISTMWYPLS